MKAHNHIVITRSRLFGGTKNIGGMENYCISFVNELSLRNIVLLIDASGTYSVDSEKYSRIEDEQRFNNAYILTLLIGLKALRQLCIKGKTSDCIVYSFGYAGILISLAKSFGFFSNSKLVVALFGLESVTFVKSKKTFFVTLQYILGIRRFFGANILRKSHAYLTEFDSHHLDYIQKYSFLKNKMYFCLPDPISIPDRASVVGLIEHRWETSNDAKHLNFISVGRDSPSKRREISLEIYNMLSQKLDEIAYTTSFIICVPQASDFLVQAAENDSRIKLIIAATEFELKNVRQTCHFCISTSDQMVPLISVLEDMAEGIIPISSDDLGSSINYHSAVLIKAADQDWIEEVLDLVQNRDLFVSKAQRAYEASLRFSREQFSSKIGLMKRLLENKDYGS